MIDTSLIDELIEFKEEFPTLSNEEILRIFTIKELRGIKSKL